MAASRTASFFPSFSKNGMESGSFEKLLKNSLDETLVKIILTIESGPDPNVEDTVNRAYK